MNKIQWEDIFTHHNGMVTFATARAKVPGGWLVSHSIRVRNEVATSTCFLPDETHEWENVEEQEDGA